MLDQISKIWAVSFLSLKGSVEMFGQFLVLTLIYNEGGALGTSFGPSFYYLITSLLILALVLYYIFANRTHRAMTYPLALIAGGALGNIIDRVRIGKVVDWIDVDFFDINLFGYRIERWWTFNLADAVISCSILFLLVSILVSKFSPSKTGTAKINSGIDRVSSPNNN